MKHLFYPFISVLFLAACSPDRSNSVKTKTEEAGEGTVLTLGFFADVEGIDSVQMRNNSGTFKLSEKQLTQFKEEIARMRYEPNESLKVGIVEMTLFSGEEQHYLLTSTNGSLVEVSWSFLTKNQDQLSRGSFFRTDELNFDNYHKD